MVSLTIGFRIGILQLLLIVNKPKEIIQTPLVLVEYSFILYLYWQKTLETKKNYFLSIDTCRLHHPI